MRGTTGNAGRCRGRGCRYRILVTNDGGTTTYRAKWLEATASNELWLAIPDGIAPAYAPDLTVGFCEGGVLAEAVDGIVCEYRARAYEEAGNHSPSSGSRAGTLSLG
ncbi:hypothetical protein ACFQ6B_11310 [Streptomyces wedmorensis]|uniref:Uncharacterized protein n=1 Tax=Streptomyces wedmorensis TaxID=43759 RepID=A0ABW6J382_STRWE